MPDYYAKFACKMGKCRSACCVGWPISLSMADYFRLLGVDCSPKLRRRLDCAMYLADYPTEERYARMNPRYDGDCPLRLPDGRCAIHAELGEEALAEVCRLYPRAPRAEGDYECSCANSCEGVLELMFENDSPMKFVKARLAFDLPRAAARTVFFETVGREQELRLYFIGKIQDRSLAFPERLMALGQALFEMETALNSRDEARVAALLAGEGIALSLPAGEAALAARLSFGLGVAEKMVGMLDERSSSIRRYGEKALAHFGEGDTEKYAEARERFQRLLPKWPAYFEHMLANHMFFERFPFQDRPESLRDEFLALCAIYALLRFLCLACVGEGDPLGDFVDIAAAAFRHIGHTSFDRYAAHMLKELGCIAPWQVYDLVWL